MAAPNPSKGHDPAVPQAGPQVAQVGLPSAVSSCLRLHIPSSQEAKMNFITGASAGLGLETASHAARHLLAWRAAGKLPSVVLQHAAADRAAHSSGASQHAAGPDLTTSGHRPQHSFSPSSAAYSSLLSTAGGAHSQPVSTSHSGPLAETAHSRWATIGRDSSSSAAHALPAAEYNTTPTTQHHTHSAPLSHTPSSSPTQSFHWQSHYAHTHYQSPQFLYAEVTQYRPYHTHYSHTPYQSPFQSDTRHSTAQHDRPHSAYHRPSAPEHSAAHHLGWHQSGHQHGNGDGSSGSSRLAGGDHSHRTVSASGSSSGSSNGSSSSSQHHSHWHSPHQQQYSSERHHWEPYQSLNQQRQQQQQHLAGGNSSSSSSSSYGSSNSHNSNHAASADSQRSAGHRGNMQFHDSVHSTQSTEQRGSSHSTHCSRHDVSTHQHTNSWNATSGTYMSERSHPSADRAQTSATAHHEAYHHSHGSSSSSSSSSMDHHEHSQQPPHHSPTYSKRLPHAHGATYWRMWSAASLVLGSIPNLVVGSVWSGIFGSVYVPVFMSTDESLGNSQHDIVKAMLPPAAAAGAASLAASALRHPLEISRSAAMAAVASGAGSGAAFIAGGGAAAHVVPTIGGAAWDLVKQKGLRGVYGGWCRSVAAGVPLDATMFVLYEGMKDQYRQANGQDPGTLVTSLVGGTAGAVAAYVTIPLDHWLQPRPHGTAAVDAAMPASGSSSGSSSGGGSSNSLRSGLTGTCSGGGGGGGSSGSGYCYPRPPAYSSPLSVCSTASPNPTAASMQQHAMTSASLTSSLSPATPSPPHTARLGVPFVRIQTSSLPDSPLRLSSMCHAAHPSSVISGAATALPLSATSAATAAFSTSSAAAAAAAVPASSSSMWRSVILPKVGWTAFGGAVFFPCLEAAITFFHVHLHEGGYDENDKWVELPRRA